MRVAVFGAGYVGLVTAACLAEIGHAVVCCDVDPHRIELLAGGHVPIHEFSLPDLIRKNLAEGKLMFTADPERAIDHGEIIFIATGTPSSASGEADVSSVIDVGRAIGGRFNSFKVVVVKSTVPVGTSNRLRSVIESSYDARKGAGAGDLFDGSFAVVANPEFLRQGSAIADFMRPDRVVIGIESGAEGRRSLDLMTRLYEPLQLKERVLVRNAAAAEFTKYAANAMLASRISVMNELANLAEALGVDIEEVRTGIGADSRIGSQYLRAGMGYGGSCLPKDLDALLRVGAAHGQPMHVLQSVQTVNRSQPRKLADKVVQHFGQSFAGLRFCIWGLAFKAGTDDMREAPSRIIVRELLSRGAEVIGHDPAASAAAEAALRQDLETMPDALARLRFAAEDPLSAAAGADALVVLTDWSGYRDQTHAQLLQSLRRPVIFDGRNIYGGSIRACGFAYYAVGH